MSKFRISLDEHAPAQKAVADFLVTPPTGTEGYRCIVDSGATGVFSGHTYKIAYYTGGSWFFDQPESGWTVWVTADSLEYRYFGGAWIPSGSNDEHGTAQGQMAFWQHSELKWKHTETSELFWDDTAKQLSTRGLQLNTSLPTTSIDTGLMRWNEDAGTAEIGLPGGVTGQVFQETFFDTKNGTTSIIPNGTPVMFAAPVGNSGKVEMQLAIADGSLPSEFIMGITTQEVAVGGFGKVTWFGKVRGIDTTGTPYGETWVDGDLIYIGMTAGSLTKVEPNAPNQRILVATVITAHTNGTLLLRPTWNPKLTELDDVNGTPLTVDGQILTWHQTEGYFDFSKNINDYSLITHEHTFAEITDKPEIVYTLTGDVTGTITELLGNNVTINTVATVSALKYLTGVNAANISSVVFTLSDSSELVESFSHVHTEYALADSIISSMSGTEQGQMMFWNNSLLSWVYADTTELFWNDEIKYLGIGNNDPLARTHITSDAGSFGIPNIIYLNTTSNSSLIVDNATLNTSILFGIGLNDYAWIQVQNSDDSLKKLSINPIGGNVGINEVDPLYTLDIGGNLRIQTIASKSSSTSFLVENSGVIEKRSLPAYPTVGTLDTTITTALATNASESFEGSIQLHKVSKTGSYSDLLDQPTIPTITPAELTKTDDINVTLTLGGTPSTSLLQAVSLTLGWAGTLADERIASANIWNGKQDALNGTGFIKISGTVISYDNTIYEPEITAGTLSQYWRGDKTWVDFPTIPSLAIPDNQIVFGNDTSDGITSDANFTWDGTSLIAGIWKTDANRLYHDSQEVLTELSNQLSINRLGEFVRLNINGGTTGTVITGNITGLVLAGTGDRMVVASSTGLLSTQPIPSIPIVNDSTITIAAGTGLTTGGDFTTNQSSNENITIDHLTTTGYKHIPTGGESGQTLTWLEDGTAQWETIIPNVLASVNAENISKVIFTLTDGTEIVESFSHIHTEYMPYTSLAITDDYVAVGTGIGIEGTSALIFDGTLGINELGYLSTSDADNICEFNILGYGGVGKSGIVTISSQDDDNDPVKVLTVANEKVFIGVEPYSTSRTLAVVGSASFFESSNNGGVVLTSTASTTGQISVFHNGVESTRISGGTTTSYIGSKLGISPDITSDITSGLYVNTSQGWKREDITSSSTLGESTIVYVTMSSASQTVTLPTDVENRVYFVFTFTTAFTFSAGTGGSINGGGNTLSASADKVYFLQSTGTSSWTIIDIK
jgi:hypothetical protein